MKYKNIVKGEFISRPNRFIAHVKIGDEIFVCHVKNTGRCKELLVPGAVVYLEKSSNPGRKTPYDLVAVEKGNILINMDSSAPNAVVYEWLREGSFIKGITKIKQEVSFGSSRFDVYIETDTDKIFAEVKGVTLEKEGVVMFPDAPTERGLKHINELVFAVEQGYKAYILFVVQMEECLYFTPNVETHPEFASALSLASKNGVNVVALSCKVSPDSLKIDKFVEAKLQ